MNYEDLNKNDILFNNQLREFGKLHVFETKEGVFKVIHTHKMDRAVINVMEQAERDGLSKDEIDTAYVRDYLNTFFEDKVLCN